MDAILAAAHPRDLTLVLDDGGQSVGRAVKRQEPGVRRGLGGSAFFEPQVPSRL